MYKKALYFKVKPNELDIPDELYNKNIIAIFDTSDVLENYYLLDYYKKMIFNAPEIMIYGFKADMLKYSVLEHIKKTKGANLIYQQSEINYSIESFEKLMYE